MNSYLRKALSRDQRHIFYKLTWQEIMMV